jgi:hypothetical protein
VAQFLVAATILTRIQKPRVQTPGASPYPRQAPSTLPKLRPAYLLGCSSASRARGLLFYRLLQQAAGTDPHARSELIGGTGNDWDELTND